MDHPVIPSLDSNLERAPLGQTKGTYLRKKLKWPFATIHQNIVTIIINRDRNVYVVIVRFLSLTENEIVSSIIKYFRVYVYVVIASCSFLSLRLFHGFL